VKTTKTSLGTAKNFTFLGATPRKKRYQHEWYGFSKDEKGRIVASVVSVIAASS
jgi:hypothetical protein